jgi:peptidase E
MVFLGSSADGSVPFAEMNGKKLIAPDSTQNGMESEGSNAIIQRVAEHFNLSWPKGTNGKTEEERLRRQIDYDLFK